MSNFKFTLLASAGAAAMLLAPLAVVPATSLPAGYSALAGNGNGNGNGGGSHGSESHGNSDNAGQHEEKASTREEAKAAKSEAKADKAGNLNAQLGRLNSLKRNINGLMNSSDPHMAGVRAYVEANAALDAAEAALAQAQADLATAQDAYDAVVGSADLASYDDTAYDTTPAALGERLTVLQQAPITDPTDPAYDAYNAEVAALETILDSTATADLVAAADAVDDAETDVADATAGTTDADLQAALVIAANKPGAVTPEMLAWAKAQLGIE